METVEALKIMRKLSEALQRAVEALERMQAREQRERLLPENAGTSWSAEEDRQLRDELRNGVDFRNIAKTHRRTTGAIVSRLAKPGMIPPRT